MTTQLTNQKIVEILTNQKPSRTDLSRIYKQLKPLGVQWMDVLRKTSRPIVIKKLNEKKGKSKSIVKFTIYTKIDVNKINGHKQKRTLNFKDKKYTQFGKMLTLTTNSTFISNNFNKGKGKANVINRDDERWKITYKAIAKAYVNKPHLLTYMDLIYIHSVDKIDKYEGGSKYKPKEEQYWNERANAIYSPYIYYEVNPNFSKTNELLELCQKMIILNQITEQIVVF